MQGKNQDFGGSMVTSMTVVVVAFNEEAHIRESLQSLRSQTDIEFELILIDDCSTDRTVEIAQEVSLPHWQIIKNDLQLGSGASRNHGIKQSKTEWVVIQDADDLSCNKRIEMLRQVLSDNPSADVIGGQLAYLGSSKAKNGVPSERPSATTNEGVQILLAKGSMPTPHPAIAIRRQAIIDVNGYSNHPRAQDLALFIKLRNHNWVIDERLHILYRRPIITRFKQYRVNSFWRNVVIWDELKLSKSELPNRIEWLTGEFRRMYRAKRR